MIATKAIGLPCSDNIDEVNHINTPPSIKETPLPAPNSARVFFIQRWLATAFTLASALLLHSAMAATATSNTTATQQPDDASDRLRPFTSDGCSAFPDGTPDQQQLWLSCCQLHDYAYWKGGAYAEREASDLALRRCVAATGQHYIAELMLNGVRIGGTPYLPTSFRWGYGWPFLRGYKPLSPKEIERAKALSQNIHWPSSPQDHHPEKMDQP